MWPAARGAVQVLGPGGLELAPGSSADVSVPHAWIGNWSPRTGCHFDSSGHGLCATGGCAGDSLACTEDASVVPVDRTQARWQPLAHAGAGDVSYCFCDCSQCCLMDGIRWHACAICVICRGHMPEGPAVQAGSALRSSVRSWPTTASSCQAQHRIKGDCKLREVRLC